MIFFMILGALFGVLFILALDIFSWWMFGCAIRRAFVDLDQRRVGRSVRNKSSTR